MSASSSNGSEIDQVKTLIGDLEAADYSQASNNCDLVMKGGVTSGVVYPTTICKLAQTFRFNSIGGTSAGALASALTAAAEYERVVAQARQAKPQGFQRLAGVPAYLGAGTNLRDLFQPSPSTAPLFRLFLTLIDDKRSKAAKLVAPFAEYWWATAIALVVAVVLFLANTGVLGPWSAVSGFGGYLLAVVALVFTFLVIAVVLIGWRIVRIVLSAIPDNEFGMCTGLQKPRASAPTPLTPWLADRIDYVAGRSDDAALDPNASLPPLTFRDLYEAGRAPGATVTAPHPTDLDSAVLGDLNERAGRVVNLEMVTTDVTAGRPYRLPFSDLEPTKFFYDRTELEAFFPKRVLDAMEHNAKAEAAALGAATPAAAPHEPIRARVTTLVDATGPTSKSKSRPQKRAKVQTLLPFPSKGLPLIVAARMSMSFPILFSAIPLYAVDRQALEAAHASGSDDAYDQLEIRKTWFSDGGLSSNIPIHFFDAPIPRWPTLALNLRGFPRTRGGRELPAGSMDPEHATEQQKVFLATTYDPDVALFHETGGGRLFQFVNSLIDAMQNWNDKTLMQLPGYRERTVEIAMLDTEGGLNLVMPADTIASIMLRGAYAADLFAGTFATPSLDASPAWNDHRHIRLRSSLLMQSEWTRRFGLVFSDATIQPPYIGIVGGANPPYGRPYDAGEVASAQKFATYLAAAPSQIETGVTLTKQPSPSPELRARPRV